MRSAVHVRETTEESLCLAAKASYSRAEEKDGGDANGNGRSKDREGIRVV